MSLNNYMPYACSVCKEKKGTMTNDLTSTMYFEPDKVPNECPVCHTPNSLQALKRICLVKPETKGVFRASKAAQAQNHGRVTRWSYWCERSCDEHSKDYRPLHTVIPEAANCPECMVKYKESLHLAGQFLRTKE